MSITSTQLSHVIELRDAAHQAAIAIEEQERAAGKVLTDDAVAHLISPPQSFHELLPVIPGHPPSLHRCGHCETLLTIPLDGGSAQTSAIFTTERGTTYLTWRRTWKAYKPALAYLNAEAVPFAEVEDLLYRLDILPFVLGALALVEHEGNVLLGIRSRQLAGTHVGMVSCPGGILKPGEPIHRGAMRELHEEAGLSTSALHRVAAVRHPDAPSITFMCDISVSSGRVTSTYEVEKGTYVWTPKEALIETLHGGMAVRDHFRSKGFDVPDELAIAPDAKLGMQRLYGIPG